MNIEVAVGRVREMSDDSVIVAKAPLTWGSEAMIVELTDKYRVSQPVKDAGYEYLIGRDDLAKVLAF
jgi:hypothetical protein